MLWPDEHRLKEKAVSKSIERFKPEAAMLISHAVMERQPLPKMQERQK
jgi:hypothetical protein